MDSLRLDTLAGHLVDWHNRRFWARRITVSHVQSMGYVVVPLVDPADKGTLPVLTDEAPAGKGAGDGAAGATLRERAMARAQQGEAPAPGPAAAPEAGRGSGARAAAAAPLKAAFTEDFIPPLNAKAVAGFASRHGAAQAQPGKDAPVRQVQADGAAPQQTQLRWLLTAQIQVGRSRTRVLVGTGLSPAVLGRRLVNTPLLVLGLALPMVAAYAGWQLGRTPAAATVGSTAGAASAAASSAAGAASSASAAPRADAGPAASSASSAASMQPLAPPTSAASSTAATATAPVAAAVGLAAASAPVASPASPVEKPPEKPPNAEPTLGQVQLPSLGPIIDERRRAAAAARAASAGAPGKTTPAMQVAKSLLGAPAFAVSTRLLRTRTESQLVEEAMRALLIGPDNPGMHVEALKAGEDWRVVGWPYVDRAQAERARAFLASRGMKVEVIDF